MRRGCFLFLRGVRATRSSGSIAASFRKAAPVAVASAADLALLFCGAAGQRVRDRTGRGRAMGLYRVVAGLIRCFACRRHVPCPPSSATIMPYATGERCRACTRGLRAGGAAGGVVVSGPVTFLAGLLALWTRRHSDGRPLHLCAADRYGCGGPLDPRSGLCELAAIGAIVAVVQGPAAGPVSRSVGDPDSLDRPAWGGHCRRRQRAHDRIRCVGRIIIRRTLEHPLRHLLFLAAVMVTVTLAGWGLGTAIRLAIPLAEPLRFFVECGYGWSSSQLQPVRSRSKASARG